MNENITQEWHAVSVTLPREGSDWISHLLFELGSVGNLEEASPDPAVIAMKGYFPTEVGPSTAIIQSILELLEEKGIRPLSTYAATIKIQNWAEAAQQMFSPIKILKDVTVTSPWSEYIPAGGEEVIVINPGMAFGTGLHATTQLAARLMTKVIENHRVKENTSPLTLSPLTLPSPQRGEGVEDVKSMCDVGCGSGILSIIAAKKGVEHIEAVEIDYDARASAAENISRNDCADTIKILENINQAGHEFDLVVANILYATILDMAEELTKRVKENGFLIISGITTEENEKLAAAFDRPGIRLVEKETRDGWMGYLFKVKC